MGFGLQGISADGGGSTGYLGVAGTNSTDDVDVIPVLSPEREPFLEYDLTRMVYNLSHPDKPVVALLSSLPINGDPALNTVWRNARLGVDPVKQGNKPMRISYAMGGSPDTRTTQVFINYRDNSASLDKLGFASFGEVVEGQDVVNKIFTGYGEGAPRGSGPEQGRIQAEGNAYLKKDFPKLDYIKKATIEK